MGKCWAIKRIDSQRQSSISKRWRGVIPPDGRDEMGWGRWGSTRLAVNDNQQRNQIPHTLHSGAGSGALMLMLNACKKFLMTLQCRVAMATNLTESCRIESIRWREGADKRGLFHTCQSKSVSGCCFITRLLMNSLSSIASDCAAHFDSGKI